MDIMLWLENPMAKAVLLYVGGFLLKKWPAFVNKAIPIAILSLSAGHSIIGSAFPDLVSTAEAATAVAASGGSWWQGALGWVGATALPAVLAIGAHSGIKNLSEWSRIGFQVLHATGRPR